MLCKSELSTWSTTCVLRMYVYSLYRVIKHRKQETDVQNKDAFIVLLFFVGGGGELRNSEISLTWNWWKGAYLQHPNKNSKLCSVPASLTWKIKYFFRSVTEKKVLRPNDFHYQSDGRYMDTVSLRAVLVQSYSSSRWTSWRDCKSSLFRFVKWTVIQWKAPFKRTIYQHLFNAKCIQRYVYIFKKKKTLIFVEND